jgi:CHAT domain-containing protein/Tfp pilus assembly protein PilF
MIETGGQSNKSGNLLKSSGYFIHLPFCFMILFSFGFASRVQGFTCGGLNESGAGNPTQCGAGFDFPTLNEMELSTLLPQDQNNTDGNKALLEGRQLAKQNTKEAHLKAIERYEEALRLFRASGNKAQQVNALLAISASYSFLKERRKALESNEQAIPLMEELGNKTVLPKVLSKVGSEYLSFGNPNKALEYLNRALPLIKDESKSDEMAAILSGIGGAYAARGERRKAVGYFEQALEIFRSTGGGITEMATLSMLATLHSKLGEKQKALDLLDQTLSLARKSDNRRGEASALFGLAGVYSSLGYKRKALDYYNQSLTAFKAAGYQLGEATALNNIGEINSELGNKQTALDYLNRALQLSRSIDGPKGGAPSLSNIGAVYSSMDEYYKALDFYFKAIDSADARKDLSGKASILHNIGHIYLLLKEERKALEHFLRALTVFQSLGDRNNEGLTLYLIGRTYGSLGDGQKALEHYHQALALGQALQDRRMQALALGQIAEVSAASGERQKALTLYNQARLLLRDIEDRDGEAAALGNLGTLYGKSGEYKKALEYFVQALSMQQALIDRRGEATTLTNMGFVYEKQGSLVKAADHYQRAINVQEKVRTDARLEEFKIKLAEQSVDVYARAVLVNVRLGRSAQAFDLSERARARTFLDQMGNARIDVLKDANEELIQKEQALRSELSALERQIGKERTQPEVDSNNETVASLQKQLSNKRVEYEDFLTDLKLRVPEYASILSIGTLRHSEVRKQLDRKTTLVSYFVTPDRTLAFIITRDSFRAVSLPTGGNSLEAQVASFRGFAEVSDPHPRPLRNLHRLLVSPLKPHLKTRRIGIIPHSTLHYLPFAALTDGRHYFGEEHVIFYLPSASALPFVRQKQKPAAKSLLALAQAQADDLPVLQYADKSVKDVATLYNTTALNAGDATEAAFRTRASGSDLVFVAAHGRLNTVSPLFSHIVLAPDKSNDGLLEVHEVYGLDLKSVGMVVLSACQTQLGGRSQGDDIIGLNRAFIYAGTPTVVASLWRVKEKQTGELMVSFFKYLKQGMSKAEALQAAQRDTRKKYSHPYHWAAFVLTGDPGI